MKKLAIALLALSWSCAQAPPDRFLPPFSPYGVWLSPAGFKLTIRRDRTYQFCDGHVCHEQVYDPLGQDELILKDFLSLPVSRRFIKLADVWLECYKAICYKLPSGTSVTPRDLVFYDSVADRDASRVCGDKECTVVGNVETKDGVLLKQADG